MNQDIERLRSRLVYENRWMRVREDAIRRKDGSLGVYGVVEKPDFALVVPFDGERLHLVEQYRYPVGGRYLEFPQGSWETQPSAGPLEVAAAELEEEIGLRAGRMERVGHLFSAYGYATQGFHVFYATDLRPVDRERGPEEQDLVPVAIEPAEFAERMRHGEVTDSASLAAFLLVVLMLRPPWFRAEGG